MSREGVKAPQITKEAQMSTVAETNTHEQAEIAYRNQISRLKNAVSSWMIAMFFAVILEITIFVTVVVLVLVPVSVFTSWSITDHDLAWIAFWLFMLTIFCPLRALWHWAHLLKVESAHDVFHARTQTACLERRNAKHIYKTYDHAATAEKTWCQVGITAVLLCIIASVVFTLKEEDFIRLLCLLVLVGSGWYVLTAVREIRAVGAAMKALNQLGR